ncbi:hypothetical protein C8F04DRAFT_1390695 [Mycena alexandri]|uniref:Uncharacterized protein n=1 Tax=Mycena alexandri TaxID=1745969 RepID=A0AAD6XBF4_9AGAR|nr:hypothetical protein C8F04DRAFT_1390695 [Mycena alexandri]
MAVELENPHLVTPLIVHDSGILLTPQLNKETLLASVVSEYKQHNHAVSALEANHKISVILDDQSQPVVFTIGSDKRFHCIRHVPGKAWERTDITPAIMNSHAEVLAFDVVQHHVSASQTKVAVCVAVKDDNSDSPYLFYTRPVTITGRTSFNISDDFVLVKQKALSITSLTILAPDIEFTKPGHIIVGSAETGDKRGTDYNVDTDPNNSAPWTTISLPETATAVLQVLGITRRASIGGSIVSLYKQELSSPDPVREASDVGTSISCLSLDGVINTSLLLDKIGDGARSVCATSTSKGLSDIYVAGLKGIGYYAAQKLGFEPDVLLPDISFKQVVAAEHSLNVSLLAVSTSNKLYYIHGVRKSTGVSPTFGISGTVFPIRQHISIISTQYNASINASEVMLVDSTNKLKHVLRDAGSGMWTEHVIHVPSLGLTTYPAFSTQISLNGNLGSAVHPGHEMLLSATEATYALVNDVPVRLTSTAGPFVTDVSGKLCIVIQANSQLAAPTITAVLKGSDQTFSFSIEPKQRLIHQWAQIRSGVDLKNAQSTAGEPIFPHTDIPDEAFNACADLLSKVPSMLVHAKPQTSGTSSKATHLYSLVLERKGTTFVVSQAWAPWDIVVEVVSSVGEFLETVWHEVEHFTKAAITIAAGVVDFFAEVGGKVLRAVLDTAGAVIRSVATILKDTLNIDITRFIALFGFLWDYPNILNTQKIVVNSVKILGARAAQTVKTNCSTLKAQLPKLRKRLEANLPPPDKTGIADLMAFSKREVEKNFMWTLLQQILNNPIIHDVQRFVSMWMLRTIALFDDVIEFPSLVKLEEMVSNRVTRLIEKLAKDGAIDVASMIRDVFNTFVQVLKGTAGIADLLKHVLSDAFWTLFDAAQDIFEVVLDLVSDVISEGMVFLGSPFKIPGISTLWTSFTQTPFSFLDVGSLFLAQIMYLVTMMWKKKLPFEVMSPWETYFPADGSDLHIDLDAKAQDTSRRLYSFQTELSTTGAASPKQYDLEGLLKVFDWGEFITNIVVTFWPELGVNPGDIPLVEQSSAAASTESALPRYSSPTTVANITTAEKYLLITGVVTEGISFLCSAARANLTAPDLHGLGSFITKLTAFILKVLSLIYTLKPPSLPVPIFDLGMSCLPAFGDIINSLPVGIWKYAESDKTGEDKYEYYAALAAATAGGADMGMNIFNYMEQPEVVGVLFFTSVVFNGLSWGWSIPKN